MSGAQKRRMFDGIWCQAEGLVYESFDEDKHVKEVDCSNALYWIVSCDTGFKDPTVLTLFAVLQTEQGLSLHLKELRYAPGRLLESSIGDMVEVWRNYYPVVIVDPSSSGTLVELGARGFNVHPAKNKIYEGVQAMNDLIKSDRFTISPACKEIPLQELNAYSLNPDTNLPDKGQVDHFLDCARYACLAVQGERQKMISPTIVDISNNDIEENDWED
jgi:hypothetical protein